MGLMFCFLCLAWREEDIETIAFGEALWDDRFSCDNTCELEITWTSPLGACGLDGNQYYNKLKNSTLSSYFQCLIKNIGKPNPNIGIYYPGSCGCPNYCNNITSSGTCVNGKCECKSGWTGPDCSQVTTENACSGIGTVQNISGFNTCVCEGPYSLNDCSAATGELPPITQVVMPVHQYSDKDDYRNNNPIFNNSVFAQLHLTMPEEVLIYNLEPANSDTDIYWPVDFWFYNGPTTEVMEKVGFRIKGFSTRNYVKKNFKLSFSKFVDGRKWAQQKKVNLKSLQQDVSALKEVSVLSLLYAMNVPAQRYGYTQLFINNQSMGNYLILENIDDQFLDSRFGNDKGPFYKCLGTLEYLGEDPELYRNATRFGSAQYSPENDAAQDFTLLRNFIRVINATSDEEFTTLLPEVFDIDLYTRILAVEVMTGNWDGLWNGNNYFLYYNTGLEKFQYFRHDLEISYGTWETFYSMATKPIYSWGDGGVGYRLINRVLATQPFREMFTSYCRQLIEVYFKIGDAFTDRIDFLNQELRPFIYQDAWKMTDFGYSYDMFVNMPNKGYALKTGSPYPENGYPFVRTYGIREFMELRIQSALQQLD